MSKPIRGMKFLMLLCLATFSFGVVHAETLVGSNMDSRVQIGFNANTGGLQAMMPAGWTSIPFPGGALKGANMLIVLEDRALGRDAEGKPTSPPNSRGLAVLGLGKQDGGDAVRLFVLKVFTTNSNYETFPGAQRAEISRRTSTDGAANEGRQREEQWNVALESGGELSLSLNFLSGKRSWITSKAQVYSSTDVNHSRVFHYDQLVDVVMSVPIGKPNSGDFFFSSTIPELADVIDGSEEVLAIIDVPVYVREVFLPD